MKEDHFDKEFEQEFDKSTAHVPNGTTTAVDTGVQLSSRASSMAVKLEEKDDDDDCIYCHEEEADDSLDAEEEAAEANGGSLATGSTGSHKYNGVFFAGQAELTEENDDDQEQQMGESEMEPSCQDASLPPPEVRYKADADACSAESARGPKVMVEKEVYDVRKQDPQAADDGLKK